MRQQWAEFKIEHLSPDEIEVVEKLLRDNRLGGAIHTAGGIAGIFRLIGNGDSFHAYYMFLTALNGLRNQSMD